MTDTKTERRAFGDALTVLALATLGILGLVLAFGAREGAMAFHGVLLAGAALIGVVAVAMHLSQADDSQAETQYTDGPIKVATVAAIVWGIAGFLVGDILAWQLAFPALNLDLPWTSFGPLPATWAFCPARTAPASSSAARPRSLAW